MDKIRTIIEKEWAEVFKNRLVLFTVAFLPLILTALPIITLSATNGLESELGAATDAPPEQFFGDLCHSLNTGECTQLYLLTLYLLLFMILPVMIPVSISAYSIVGEKTTRSLEPLLATPITTTELLLGKTIAAIIPAVLVTWIAFIIYLIFARIMTSTAVFTRLLDPMWFVAIFVVGPLLALMSVNIAIMISSRVNDPRVAEQLSGAVVLPIILVVVGQSTGLFILTRGFVLIFAFILLIIDIILVFIGLQVFEREKILTRWK